MDFKAKTNQPTRKRIFINQKKKEEKKNGLPANEESEVGTARRDEAALELECEAVGALQTQKVGRPQRYLPQHHPFLPSGFTDFRQRPSVGKAPTLAGLMMARAGEKTGVVNHCYVGTPINVGPGSSRILAGGGIYFNKCYTKLHCEVLLYHIYRIIVFFKKKFLQLSE